MSRLIKAEQYLKFCEETSHLKNQTEVAFIELGRRLQKINTEKMWYGRWEDFDHYCRSELKMSKQTAYKLIAIYDKFVIQYKIPPSQLAQAGGWSIVAQVLPMVKDEDTAKDWIHQAIHAESKRDLVALIRESKTGIDPIRCEHENTTRYTVVECKDCGESWREYEEDNKKHTHEKRTRKLAQSKKK